MAQAVSKQKQHTLTMEKEKRIDILGNNSMCRQRGAWRKRTRRQRGGGRGSAGRTGGGNAFFMGTEAADVADFM